MNLQRIWNNVVGLTGLLALALSASLAFAEVKEVMKIKVKTDDGLTETVKIENLGVGETEVFTTESGREVLVTRFDDALKLELDGQVIDVKMPQIHTRHEGRHGERHARVMHKDGGHDLEADGIFVTEDDEVIVADGMTKHVIVRREMAGDGDLEGDVTCDIEIEVDGATEEEVMAELGDLCDEPHDGHGERVIIKKKVMVESESSDEG